jgi:hypothetical protein
LPLVGFFEPLPALLADGATDGAADGEALNALATEGAAVGPELGATLGVFPHSPHASESSELAAELAIDSARFCFRGISTGGGISAAALLSASALISAFERFK